MTFDPSLLELKKAFVAEFVVPKCSFKCETPILAEATPTAMTSLVFFYNPDDSLQLIGVYAINSICCFS